MESPAEKENLIFSMQEEVGALAKALEIFKVSTWQIGQKILSGHYRISTTSSIVEYF